MKMKRLAIAAAAAGLLMAGAVGAAAQNYPTKTIKLIVGYGPGGGTDTVARLMAQHMQESLGQSVVVENRPGGNAMIGPDYVAKSPADGYTLLYGGQGQITVSPVIYSKMPYSLKDFIPVAMMARYPLIFLVSANHPAKTMKEFIAWAKANPDKVNYATASPAFTLAMELFKLRTGTQGQMIPYKSGNDQVTSVMSDQVTYTMAEPPSSVPNVLGGKVRALAVAAPVRLPELPDVPTMQEAGVDVNVSLWAGMFAVAGTPPDIVKKIETESVRISKLPDFRARLRQIGTESPGMVGQEFQTTIDREIELWRGVARQANLKFE
jgi:tripartite-type tricarboxylate transporter receptor subunit TctC